MFGAHSPETLAPRRGRGRLPALWSLYLISEVTVPNGNSTGSWGCNLGRERFGVEVRVTYKGSMLRDKSRATTSESQTTVGDSDLNTTCGSDNRIAVSKYSYCGRHPAFGGGTTVGNVTCEDRGAALPAWVTRSCARSFAPASLPLAIRPSSRLRISTRHHRLCWALVLTSGIVWDSPVYFYFYPAGRWF